MRLPPTVFVSVSGGPWGCCGCSVCAAEPFYFGAIVRRWSAVKVPTKVPEQAPVASARLAYPVGPTASSRSCSALRSLGVVEVALQMDDRPKSGLLPAIQRRDPAGLDVLRFGSDKPEAYSYLHRAGSCVVLVEWSTRSMAPDAVALAVTHPHQFRCRVAPPTSRSGPLETVRRPAPRLDSGARWPTGPSEPRSSGPTRESRR